jgi:crossover junction endodeoxyribonuclease RuvC
MNSLYFGIDPGMGGGLAAIYGASQAIYTAPMPQSGHGVDPERIAAWFMEIYDNHQQPEHVAACIEKVSAMPGQGVTSMFSFGMSTGIIHGVLGALQIPRYMVTPQAWKKIVLAGTKKDKDAAIAFCRMAYPSASLLPTPRCYKPNDGMAEALCLAHYALIKRL